MSEREEAPPVVVVELDEPQKETDESGEKPPAYESLQRVAVHELPKQSDARGDATLIAEAPPSYQDLFGRKQQQSGARRPHTRPRRGRQQDHGGENISWAARLRQRYPNMNKWLARLTVVCVISCFIGLSFAMIVIGSLNVELCASVAIPIYLVVAGILMIIEVIVHGSVWLLMKRSESETTFRALRVCDCITFIILLWLLIGSHWVFKLSISHHSLCVDTPQPIDDVIYLNTTVVTDASGGTQLAVVSETRGSTPNRHCTDCSRGVYQFTAVVILFQYVVALFVIVGCCSKLFKK